MWRVYLLLLLVGTSCHLRGTQASCKASEKDPWEPHPEPSQRIFTYPPADPSQATVSTSGGTLNILSYNIQSGLNMQCGFDLDAQTSFMHSPHFFGLQEIDMFVDLRCNCSQPEHISQLTGHTVVFLCTVLYRTGLYGSAIGTAFPILETRYSIYSAYSWEKRGVTAIKTQPPQLGGRTLWFLNTHLEYNSEIVRSSQAMDLVNFAKTLASEFPEALFIVAGDYYAVPGLESFAILEAYFLNAWTTFHGTTADGYTYPADFPSNRFDHIWYLFPAGTKYTLKDVQVVNSLYSDHRPLIATFDFGTSATSASATTSSSSSTSSTTSSSSVASTTSASTSSTTSSATTSSTSSVSTTSPSFPPTTSATSAASTTAATTSLTSGNPGNPSTTTTSTATSGTSGTPDTSTTTTTTTTTTAASSTSGTTDPADSTTTGASEPPDDSATTDGADSTGIATPATSDATSKFANSILVLAAACLVLAGL